MGALNYSNCSLLNELPNISSWFKSNKNRKYTLEFPREIDKKDYQIGVVYIRYMFFNCSSLKSLPDISEWNIEKVEDLSYLFYGCSSLIKLPDISKWNTSNINDLSYIFCECSSLTFIIHIKRFSF